ncbi:PE-PPE domain-containing protein [Mycobacterium sp. pV006]|uniref:PE-PPE domain-containing protein n=1 Tax=Mycobacterium sp. pV006 TaxID=3238983 RepID=UPI00351B253B
MGTRSGRTVGGALAMTLTAAATALSVVVATPTAEAANVLTLSPLPHRMGPALQGSMCASPNVCNKVKYSFAMNVSIANLAEAIRAATAAVPAPDGSSPDPADSETVTVFALSGGAIGSVKWLAQYADEADAPSAEVLSFVLIGNPTRKYGGANHRLTKMPETQYKVLDIAQQYDPFADTPDRFSFLAQLNSTLGFLAPLHYDYSAVDINDPANYRWVEGNTTYILVPTEKLPLLAPLRALGLTALADRLNDSLKEIIERAYDRPWEKEPPPPPAPEARQQPSVQKRAPSLPAPPAEAPGAAAKAPADTAPDTTSAVAETDDQQAQDSDRSVTRQARSRAAEEQEELDLTDLEADVEIEAQAADEKADTDTGTSTAAARRADIAERDSAKAESRQLNRDQRDATGDD